MAERSMDAVHAAAGLDGDGFAQPVEFVHQVGAETVGVVDAGEGAELKKKTVPGQAFGAWRCCGFDRLAAFQALRERRQRINLGR